MLLSVESLMAQQKTLEAVRKERREEQAAARYRVQQYLRGKAGRTINDPALFLLADVSPSGQPVYRIPINAGAAQTSGAAVLHSPQLSGLNLQGENMTIAVWDNGKIKDHIELGDRVLSTEGELPQEHATHVTGTLIATGINPLAKGMAPLAKAKTFYFVNDDEIMAALAKADQSSLLLSSHSYGTAVGWHRNGNSWQWVGDPSFSSSEDYLFGFYSERTRVLDEIAFLAPYYSIFWAAGNDRADRGDGSRPADCNSGTGYDCIIPDAVGKNIFTIGAVGKVFNYTGSSSVVMGDYSSWGPTDDGRIKPDLVGAGTDVFSLSASGENTYTTLSGTSMATPNVAGSLLLVQELFSKINGGRFMRAASLKALAIHTAKEAGSFDGPDYSFGWGLVDVAAAADLLMKENGVDHQLKELTLHNSETILIPIQPKANSKVTVTIAWTDPAGAPVNPSLDPITSMLVNDLDIRVVDENGNENKPWVLDPNIPSRQAFKGDNFRDNVEKIEFTVSEAKPLTVRVTHKGVLKNDQQDFSLVLSYDAVESPKTYYWVGGTGTWQDGTHWARQSGGLPANEIPSVMDRVVVDENSVDDSGSTEITMTENASIASFRWINAMTAKLNMNNHSLTVGSEFSLSSQHSVLENGQLVCDGNGSINWQTSQKQAVTLVIETGSWHWRGNVKLNELRVVAGELEMEGASVSLDVLEMTSATPKRVDLNETRLAIVQSAQIQGDQLDLTSTNAWLTLEDVETQVELTNVEWQGKVQAQAGSLTLQGYNKIDSLIIIGSCRFNQSVEVHSLEMEKGSSLLISGGTLQLDQASLRSTAENPIELKGIQDASIEFMQRGKICYDYLSVTSLKLMGAAMVTAGEHSVIADSPNWQASKCEDVLFADFDIAYPCQGGMAELTQKSQGLPDTWSWATNAAISFLATARQETVLVPITDATPINITLEAKSGTKLDQVTKTLTPLSNNLAANQIVKNEETLVSFVQGETYKWFRNGVEVEGAVGRSLNYQGVEGAYLVVAYGKDCNSASDIHLITGIGEGGTDYYIYPNPAHSSFFIKGGASLTNVRIVTPTGQQWPVIRKGDEIDVRALPEGLYVVILESSTGSVQRKIRVTHSR